LPRTANGKVRKADLRAQLVREAQNLGETGKVA
jgi:hypothetical protein